MTPPTHRSLKAAGLAAAVGALLAAAPAAQAETVFGITKKAELAEFDSKNPSDVKLSKLKGLPDGVKLVGIDERPANGDLYGIGDDSTVYVISESGKADAVGDGFGNPQVMPIVSPGAPLEGRSFAVDFNPVPDAIRIVSNTGQNLRVSPSSGDLISEDGEINGADASIVSGAYTNSEQTEMAPETAVLYVLDAKKDRVYTQSPPNDGTLVNPVDLDIDVTKKGGFDLIGSGDKGLISTTRKGVTKLFQIKRENDLGLEGNTKSLGKVKAGSALIGIAVDQPQPK